MSERLPGVEWEQFMPYLRGEHDSITDGPEPTIDLTRRYASDIQSHVIKEVERSGYPQSQASREDIAYHFVEQHLSREVEPDEVAWDALIVWYRTYKSFTDGGMIV